MSIKNVKFLGVALFSLGVLALGYLYFIHRSTSSLILGSLGASTTTNSAATGNCLSSDEIASYPASEENPSLGAPNTSTINISVLNKKTGEPLSTFQIQNVGYAYQSLEIQPCGVYVIRSFDDNGRVELWRYTYAGVGVKLLTFL